MKVPQFMPFVGMEEYEAIKQCFETNWITEGPLAKEFNLKLAVERLARTAKKKAIEATAGVVAGLAIAELNIFKISFAAGVPNMLNCNLASFTDLDLIRSIILLIL